MVNGQEPESATGKYYRHVDVLKIAHVTQLSCGVTACVLCFFVSDIVSLPSSED